MVTKKKAMLINKDLRQLLVAVLFSLSFEANALACDPCALYNTNRLRSHSAGTLTLSVSEQFTDFNRASNNAENSVRDGEFVKSFSTTQLSLSYDLTDKFALQATIPVLARRFDEVKQFRSSVDSDSGFGDVSLVGSYSVLDYKSSDWMVKAGLTGGVKLPTGDTGVLEEVANEEADQSTESLIFKHHQIGSTSGGRALTFGTGSYDYIFGSNLVSRYQRFLALTAVQYTLRTEGKFNYQFANDLLMSVGGGYYFHLEHDFSLAGLIVFSGEFKGRDNLNGELVTGSQVSNLYLGPGILFTLNENIGAEMSLDFRVTGEDKDATVVPESRIRATVSYRF